MDNTLIEIIAHIFSNSDASSIDGSLDSLVELADQQGYSIDDIRDALESVLHSSHHDISFLGSENAEKIAQLQSKLSSLQGELRTANQDISYYERELRNVNEHSTKTWISGCKSHLEQAINKASELSKEINNTKNKIDSLK